MRKTIKLFLRIISHFIKPEEKLEIKKIRMGESNKSGMRFLVLSDLHLNINLKEMTKKMNALSELEHDVVILLGDIFEWSYKSNHKEAIELLQNTIRLSSKQWIAVNGNHDNKKTLEILKKENVLVLENESMDFDNIFIYGLSEKSPSLNYKVDKNKNVLLLSHRPDHLIGIGKEFIKKNVFAVSGHTHGGQIKFGNFIPVKNTQKKSMVYGFWNVDGLNGYTTSGMGSSGAPIRLGTSPEVVVLYY